MIIVRLGIMILFALCVAAAVPARARSFDDVTGLWGTQIRFGPSLRGTLAVRRSASRWTASIGPERTSFMGRGSAVRFQFEGGSAFRGILQNGSLVGFWVQPSGESGSSGDPGGAGQSYATPIQLRPAGVNSWRGTIIPLENSFTLWLSIFRVTDGTLTAAFRNPELNSNGGASQFSVERSGDILRFVVKANGREIAHSAELLHNPDRIRIAWPDIGRTVDLAARKGAAAASFYPQPPGTAPYVYRRPPQLTDGWRTADAAKTGLDEGALQSMVRAIMASDPAARPATLMHSILIAHHGQLVLEEYFYGYRRSMVHDLRSAGKTFASVMLGTRPARLARLSPSSRIYDVLHGLGPFANPDPRQAQITLGHLMTHTSGLACNDNDDNSPGNEATMQSQKAEPNWWRYTLNLPVAHDPGTRYAYCSAGSNLVGGALTAATATWLPELFRGTIAEPLQFGEWHWNLMPNGEGYAGGGAFLLPRDLLKIGQTYLDRGLWNGRRIVPKEWVRTSTRAAVDVTPKTTGLTPEEFRNFYIPAQDGLAWHLGSVTSGNRRYASYQASGNGGQLLVVVPEADLAVVFTGGNYGQGGVWLQWPQHIIGDQIIPAIRSRIERRNTATPKKHTLSI